MPPQAWNWPTFPRKHPVCDVHELRLMRSHRVAVPEQVPPTLLHPNTEPQPLVPATLHVVVTVPLQLVPVPDEPPLPTGPFTQVQPAWLVQALMENPAQPSTAGTQDGFHWQNE